MDLPSIGGLISFTTGPLAGVTLRAELDELQKADLGRKYARKDRRPLDPPPVIRLKLFEVVDTLTPSQSEKLLTEDLDMKTSGLLCHVDLFPVPEVYYNDEQGRKVPASIPVSIRPLMHSRNNERGVAHSHLSTAPTRQLTTPMPIPSTTSSSSLQPIPEKTLSQSCGPPLSNGGLPFHPQAASASSRSTVNAAYPDVVAYFGEHPIRENSKCTGALVGTTFVAPSCLDYKGTNTVMFIFSFGIAPLDTQDLAVKAEGTFILRYRTFNVLSGVPGMHGTPVLAECYGGPFKVYSTKNFPGLRASTDLTKHISFFGVRLNSRTTERKRQKRSEPQPSGAKQILPISPAHHSSSSEGNYHVSVAASVSETTAGAWR